MNLKGTYKLTYIVNKEVKEILVSVNLILRDGVVEPFQNLYVGIAVVNGKTYEDDSLETCVDAKLAAEKIGHKLKDKIKSKAKKDGKSFRIKKEEIIV